MHAPQYIYLALLMLGLGVSLAEHGKPRKNTSFPLAITCAFIALGLLYWGGFFTGGAA